MRDVQMPSALVFPTSPSFVPVIKLRVSTPLHKSSPPEKDDPMAFRPGMATPKSPFASALVKPTPSFARHVGIFSPNGWPRPSSADLGQKLNGLSTPPLNRSGSVPTGSFDAADSNMAIVLPSLSRP